MNLWYANGPVGTPQSQVLKFNLENTLGCSVTTKPFQGFAIYTAAGVKGADYDAMFGGWNADYPDAYDFFHILLDGTTIHETNNNNLAYINDGTLNKRIAQANLLTGDARLEGVRQLDVYTMKVRTVGPHRQPEPARLHRPQRRPGTCSSRPTRPSTSAVLH